jgi:parallel beta-helix repeat protein
MKRTITTCLLVSLILLSAIAAVKPVEAAKTLTVPGDYSTIQQAIDAAGDDDTILVRKGTYNEQLVINKQIVLRGEDKTNTIIATPNSGAIILVSHDNVEVTGFTVRHDGSGRGYPLWYWSSGKAAIHLLNVEYCNIHHNLIVSRGCGIWLYGSHQNRVSDNTVQECDYGIALESSNGNALTGNTMANNTNGLSFMSSSNNVLRNNALQDNSHNLAISSSDLSGFVNDVDVSNVIEGKPIYYWVSQSDRSVPSDAGCVVLVNCQQIQVDGLTLTAANQAAITLAGTQSCTVTNNNLSGSNIGIQLFNALYDGIFNNYIDTSGEGIQSNGNGTIIQNNNIKANTGISIGGYYQTVIGNTVNAKESGDYTIACSGQYNNITQNSLQAAMRGLTITGPNNLFYSNTLTNCWELMVNSDNNVIAKNTLTGSRLSVDGSKNIIAANTITGTGEAIYLGFAKNNTFYANTIKNNAVAVTIGSDSSRTSGNVFYLNNFIANERQVGKNNLKNTANFWDNGKEGNYWSDRDQTSIYKPYEVKSTYHVPAKEENIEFICGKDNFPLKNPYNISNAIIALPEWIDPAKPSTIIQPQDSNVNKPSTTQPTDQIQLLPIAVIAATIIMATITVTLALYLKRRSKR